MSGGWRAFKRWTNEPGVFYLAPGEIMASPHSAAEFVFQAQVR
jgi:hypothetical protein